jgi:hypothetical protein
MKKLCRKSGKVKYATHERALMRGGKVLSDPPPALRGIKAFSAYRCPDCNHFHLTSY